MCIVFLCVLTFDFDKCIVICRGEGGKTGGFGCLKTGRFHATFILKKVLLAMCVNL